MIKDDDLRHTTDYSSGQKEAAFAVLGEIANLFVPFSEDISVIGGWVPSLLFPGKEHIGSIDVDVLLNQLKIKQGEGYETIKQILTKNGYSKHPTKYFTFVKTIKIDGFDYDVDVDFLSGKYGGNDGNTSKHVDGIKTLPATGGNFAFEFPPVSVQIEYRRSDGALDIAHVQVISIVPYLIMKTAALGRGKPKDAYDIYYCINHYQGGVQALTKELSFHKDQKLLQEMCTKLKEKFASPEHSGPKDIVTFLDIHDDEEMATIRQDVYQKIMYLASTLQQH